MQIWKWKQYLKKEVIVQQIPIIKIRSNPYQPRRYFQRNALEELAASIRTYGILQPLRLRPMNAGYYELITGERRLQAAELAGLETVPALIQNVSECDSAVYVLLENIQRQSFSCLEEAEGYHSLMEDYGLSLEEVAKRLCKSQSYIAEKLRILKLDDPIKRLLSENHCSERHARALLRLPDDGSRMLILEQTIREELSPRQTEALVEETLSQMRYHISDKPHLKEKHHVTDFRLYTNTVKQAVDAIRRAGGIVTYTEQEDAETCEIQIHLQKQPQNTETAETTEA